MNAVNETIESGKPSAIVLYNQLCKMEKDIVQTEKEQIGNKFCVIILKQDHKKRPHRGQFQTK
ncbi:hypothetical protein AO498_11585 [Algoriphagus sanaruensis]|uniref:Uncharacterized protein n=1 Tax=Algoriphagus sanaruensis TaxID=1727163 RepID=A0A142EPM4_9BACT|nr:hypothetical protein AO498_11585 [Algoriphagus sanaruensis]